MKNAISVWEFQTHMLPCGIRTQFIDRPGGMFEHWACESGLDCISGNGIMTQDVVFLLGFLYFFRLLLFYVGL